MLEKSIRDIIKTRDEVGDDVVNEMFLEAEEELDGDADPDDVLQDVFGLEPDYFWDTEFQLAVDGAWSEKSSYAKR